MRPRGKARSPGMMRRRVPPTRIESRPSSRPGMTWPTPTLFVVVFGVCVGGGAVFGAVALLLGDVRCKVCVVGGTGECAVVRAACLSAGCVCVWTMLTETSPAPHTHVTHTAETTTTSYPPHNTQHQRNQPHSHKQRTQPTHAPEVVRLALLQAALEHAQRRRHRDVVRDDLCCCLWFCHSRCCVVCACGVLGLGGRERTHTTHAHNRHNKTHKHAPGTP